MSERDEIALIRLAHSYGAAVDAQDRDALVGVFLPDGSLTVERGGEVEAEYHGHEGLARIVDAVEPFDLTLHEVVRHQYDVRERQAQGVVHGIAHQVLWATGTDTVLYLHYTDDYERDHEERWRFARRHLHMDWIEQRHVSRP